VILHGEFSGKALSERQVCCDLLFINKFMRFDMKKIWKIERGFNELYAADPERADWEIWGRIVQPQTRRGFLKKSGLLAMAWAVGGNIPFADKMPAGLMPVSLANATEPFIIPGKHPEMVILNDKPLNMEARAHLLDDEITPWDKMFVRNNGIPPVNPDAATWTLTIDGESVKRQVTFTLQELAGQGKPVDRWRSLMRHVDRRAPQGCFRACGP
jgi:hypothetical protein